MSQRGGFTVGRGGTHRSGGNKPNAYIVLFSGSEAQSPTATESDTVSKNELDALRQLMKQLEMSIFSSTSSFA